MQPIQLQPIYQQRVWGGRELERLYRRKLPPDGQPYGESWEVVDRPEAQSTVSGGPLDGLSLHELWTDHKEEVFGKNAPSTERFPLLLKILDSREDLSLQVHPPASVAKELNGEPKTEMWYVAHADPGATLAVGVKPGVNREAFSEALNKGTVAELVPRLPVTEGEFIFIPSGRLHAIGSGLVIFEIQQNSDTTYRVFDWNRVGLDGKPRELHVEESLKCIDFDDHVSDVSPAQTGTLVKCDYFTTSRFALNPLNETLVGSEGEFSIVAIVSGEGSLGGLKLKPGDHCLVPASASTTERLLKSTTGLIFLQIGF